MVSVPIGRKHWTQPTDDATPPLFVPSRGSCIASGCSAAGLEILLSFAHMSVHSHMGIADYAFIVLNAVAMGGTVWLLTYMLRWERIKALYRLRIIGTVNHNIRNALQVMIMSGMVDCPYAAINVSCSRPQVRESIERIQWVLTDVLPQIQHASPDSRSPDIGS